MAGETDGEEMFRLATLAASQSDREGTYYLGFCLFEFGYHGCEKNLEMAKESYLITAELGGVYAMERFGALIQESDPLRWFWWGQAAKRGRASSLLQNFAEQLSQFESGSRYDSVIFLIGRALNGHVSVEESTIFGENYNFDNLIGPTNTAISFHKSQLSACRRVEFVLSSTRHLQGSSRFDRQHDLGES
jgi:hypothetical protein